MDRPSQEPPDPPSEAGRSPLSFPVEAPKLTGVEPGTGAPLASPAEATDPLAFPAEAAPADAAPDRRPAFPAEAPSAGPAGSALPTGNPLAFPAETAQSAADPLDFPSAPAHLSAAAPADPLAFPTQAPPPAEQLPYPVAELPGLSGPPAQPAQPAQPGPAAPAAEPASPPTAPAGTGLRRFLPPALTALAALLAVGGCFLPLFRLQQHLSVRQGFFEAQLTVTETAWGSRIEIPGQAATDQAASPVGVPLILAVVLLVAAAFVAFSRPERGRWLVTAGAFFTAGVVTTVGMSGLGWSAMADGVDLEVVVASGMWLLIVATALAGVAAVLAHLPTNDGWADPSLAYADTPTPPSGVAITVLPPEPELPGQSD